MSDVIYFECSTLPSNKQGVLAEERGAYIQAVGALNVYNSAGAFYTGDEALAIFHESASFMRRVKNGDCKGEEGHPKPFGMTKEEYVARVSYIEEKNVCNLHRRLWLDDKPQGDGSILIYSEIVPTGYYGPALKQSYANPGENVNFSLRSFTEDRWMNGRVEKKILEIVTFDHVTEPGIDKARSFKAPGLESFGGMSITPTELKAADIQMNNMGLESSGLVVTPKALFDAMGWSFKNTSAAKPSYLKWLDQ